MPDWLFDPIVAATLLIIVYCFGFAFLGIAAAIIDRPKPLPKRARMSRAAAARRVC